MMEKDSTYGLRDNGLPPGHWSVYMPDGDYLITVKRGHKGECILGILAPKKTAENSWAVPRRVAVRPSPLLLRWQISQSEALTAGKGREILTIPSLIISTIWGWSVKNKMLRGSCEVTRWRVCVFPSVKRVERLLHF